MKMNKVKGKERKEMKAERKLWGEWVSQRFVKLEELSQKKKNENNRNKIKRNLQTNITDE